MINIENILSTKIETYPWPYQLVDNILADNSFQIILDGTQILKEKAIFEPRDPNGLWMFKAHELGVDDKVVDLIMDINVQLLTRYKDVLALFDDAMHSKLGYFSIPRFNFIGPNVKGTIHDEGDSKTMALVIYLSPEQTQGTKLYTTQDYSSLAKQVEWKPNRGFLMCSQPGTTWHSFASDHCPRLTVNFFYEKMEKMSYINNLGDKELSWFYEEFANDRVSISI